VRNIRRRAVRHLTAQQKDAAIKMLPPSRRMMGARIQRERRKLIQLMRMPVSNAAEAARKRSAIAEQAKILAGIVGAAKAQRSRRARGDAGRVKLTPEQVKARRAVVLQELKETRAALKEVAPTLRRGGPAVNRAMNTRAVGLLKRQAILMHRLQLLREGCDLARPRKIHPSRAAVQRKLLKLPPAVVPPTRAEVVMIMRIIARGTPRQPGENQGQYLTQLRALTGRALVRLARRGVVAGAARGEAIRQAVEEVLQEDIAPIKSEIAAGGVAVDVAADQMEPFIDEAAADLEAAATDVTTPVPEKDPSPDQVEQLLQTATVEEAAAAEAPKEESDEVVEDIFFSDFEEEEPEPVGEAASYLTPRNLLIGGAVIVGILLLTR
jgi:hypothetical protein